MIDISPKQVPIGQYEYVDVAFGPANQDLVVPYTNLRVDDRNSVRWLDVSQGGLANGTPAIIYRVFGTTTAGFGPTYLVLRCTVADYRTRLLLFTERI